MISLPIDEQLIIKATTYVDTHKIGRRKKFNGNRTNQVVGITGELMVAELLGATLPETHDFDGGWDFNFSGKQIDVKTVGRTSNARLDYYSNVIEAQIHFKATHYLFCSLNKNKRELTICGFISKEDFLRKAEYKKAGDTFTRVNGDTMVLKATGYFIKNSDLIQIDSIAQLKELVIFN